MPDRLTERNEVWRRGRRRLDNLIEVPERPLLDRATNAEDHPVLRRDPPSARSGTVIGARWILVVIRKRDQTHSAESEVESVRTHLAPTCRHGIVRVGESGWVDRVDDAARMWRTAPLEGPF